MDRTYLVTLAVAYGAIFDTGERIRQRVMAPDRLSAALEAERLTDAGLRRPDIMYSHTRHVALVSTKRAAMAMAA